MRNKLLKLLKKYKPEKKPMWRKGPVARELYQYYLQLRFSFAIYVVVFIIYLFILLNICIVRYLFGRPTSIYNEYGIFVYLEALVRFKWVLVKVLVVEAIIVLVGIIILDKKQKAEAKAKEGQRQKAEKEFALAHPVAAVSSELWGEAISAYVKPDILYKPTLPTKKIVTAPPINYNYYLEKNFVEWRKLITNQEHRYLNEDIRAVYLTFEEYQHLIQKEIDFINSNLLQRYGNNNKWEFDNKSDVLKVIAGIIGSVRIDEELGQFYQNNMPDKLKLKDLKKTLAQTVVYDRCHGFDKITTTYRPLSAETIEYMRYTVTKS